MHTATGFPPLHALPEEAPRKVVALEAMRRHTAGGKLSDDEIAAACSQGVQLCSACREFGCCDNQNPSGSVVGELKAALGRAREKHDALGRVLAATRAELAAGRESAEMYRIAAKRRLSEMLAREDPGTAEIARTEERQASSRALVAVLRTWGIGEPERIAEAVIAVRAHEIQMAGEMAESAALAARVLSPELVLEPDPVTNGLRLRTGGAR